MKHKKAKTHTQIVVIALISYVLFILLTILLPLPGELAKLLFNKVEGTIFPYPFTIQNLMWGMFYIGLGELYYRKRCIKYTHAAFDAGYLPSDDRAVLQACDMGKIYRTVKLQENPLAELIKSLVLRFQAGKSVEETHSMLNSQLEMWQYRLDVDYNMLRYLSWLIPTLGFIGTVVGISQALAYAGSGNIDPTSADFLPTVTLKLGVAFDTTLLALVMSAILVFGMHLIQGREERIIEQSGQYCLDNLINRLYVDQQQAEK